MDLNKIFIKGASKAKVGGQALLEGIMMRGEKEMAVAIRLPDDSIHIKKEELPAVKKIAKIPIVRGVFVFAGALVQGIKTLLYSAEVLEEYEGEGGLESDKVSEWMENKFGKKTAWNIMLYSSVVFAILFAVGIFIIAPTAVVNFMKTFTENEVLLNLFEGLLRIILFVIYILIISRLKDIRRTFQYHGAEHKCIHCYESGKDLTVENCKEFSTIHPRCGTSFLMFVMVISLITFSLLGWPDLLWRIGSRIVLLPVIAGVSFELLKWAGNSDGAVVKAISIPGLYLQKLTTVEPEDDQLEVAIAALNQVK
ncbi:MAG: DUF1385 domain-containing protein [Anaerovoracaceae bacterium]